MKNIHSQFRKGQKIIIIKLNGDVIIDKYIEKTSKGFVAKDNRINLKDVRSVGIYKQKPAVHRQKDS